MYQSKFTINKKPLLILKKTFLEFLQSTTKIYCSALKRPIFLDKQPEAILNRKDAKVRLAAFDVAIDILKHSKICKTWQHSNSRIIAFSIHGLSLEGYLVSIHIREETFKKDRRLYLISIFYKDK